jgi:hypothetical protein
MSDAILNMINHSKAENALDFEVSFKDVMLDRITNAINNKKIEVAQSIFRDSTEDTEEVEDVEVTTDSAESEEVAEVAEVKPPAQKRRRRAVSTGVITPE